MSNNLNISDVVEKQNSAHVTINDQKGALDAALTETYDCDFTSGNVSLTNAQFRENIHFNATNLSTARSLTVPAIKRLFAVSNAGGTATLTVTRGSTTIDLDAGESGIFYTDSTTNGLEQLGGGSGGASSALDWKESVRVATTAAGTLSLDFENGDTVDGVTLATGDRILIKDQASGAENGIYTVNASGAPTRATDANTSAEVTSAMAVSVEEGTTNADTIFILTTNNPITLDTTALTFTEFSGGGGASAFTGLSDAPSSYSGQAGKVPAVNSGETALEFSDIGISSGDLVELGEYSVSAGSALDIDLPSGYRAFVLEGYAQPATDGSDLHLNVTDDGFSTVESGASDYAHLDGRLNGTSSNTVSGSTGDSKIVLANNIGNATNEHWQGMIHISGAVDSALHTEFYTRHGRINSGSTYNMGYGGGRYKVASTINGVRLTASSGNLTANFKLYGFKEDGGVQITAYTGTSETLALADRGTRVTMNNASANTLTVPLNSSVAFPVGTVIEVEQIGAGTTSIAATGGVTIRSRSSFLDISAQYGVVKLHKVATDTWNLSGDLA